MIKNQKILYNIQPYCKDDVKNKVYLFSIIYSNPIQYQFAKKFLITYKQTNETIKEKYKSAKNSNNIRRISGIVSYLQDIGWLTESNSPTLKPVSDYFDKKFKLKLKFPSKKELSLFNLSAYNKIIELSNFAKHPELEQNHIWQYTVYAGFLASSFNNRELLEELGINIHEKKSIQEFLEEFSSKFSFIVERLRDEMRFPTGSYITHEIPNEIANLYFQFFNILNIEEVRDKLNKMTNSSYTNSLKNLMIFISDKLGNDYEHLKLLFVFSFLPIRLMHEEWPDDTKSLEEFKEAIKQKLVSALKPYRGRKVKNELIKSYMESIVNNKNDYLELNKRIKILEKTVKLSKEIKKLLDDKKYVKAYKKMEELEKPEFKTLTV